MALSDRIRAAVRYELRHARAEGRMLTIAALQAEIDREWRILVGDRPATVLAPAPPDDAPMPGEWIAPFLGATCRGDPTATVRATELYAAYRRWSVAQGAEPLSRITFGRELRDFGYHTQIGSANVMYWRKLALRDDVAAALKKGAK